MCDLCHISHLVSQLMKLRKIVAAGEAVVGW